MKNAEIKPAVCGRCRKAFIPEWNDLMKRPTTMCETCRVRNIFDGLGMMTPPEMLDEHTLRPALTDSEFRRSIDPSNKSEQTLD